MCVTVYTPGVILLTGDIALCAPTQSYSGQLLLYLEYRKYYVFVKEEIEFVNVFSCGLWLGLCVLYDILLKHLLNQCLE